MVALAAVATLHPPAVVALVPHGAVVSVATCFVCLCWVTSLIATS